jgi:hypothetical protein
MANLRMVVPLRVPFFAFTLIVCLASDARSQSGYWSVREPVPTARVVHGVAAADGQVFAAGGFIGGAPSAVFESYDPDPAVDTWTPRPPMLTPRTNGVLVELDGLLYAIGGSSTSHFLRNVEAFDPRTNQWFARTPMPKGRSAFAAAAHDGKIYVFSGVASCFADDRAGVCDFADHQTFVYDASINSWSVAANLPLGHGQVSRAAGSIGGYVYVLGSPSAFFRYDPTADDFTARASLSFLSMPAYAVLKDRLYVVGGGPSKEMHSYDPDTDTWTSEPDAPTARDGGGAAVVADTLYFTGGITASGLTGANEAFTITPADTTPPRVTPQITPPPNEYGWHKDPLTIEWKAADDESGIATLVGCDPTTVTTEGELTVTCSATNRAGLSTSSSVTVRLDRTLPTISLVAPRAPYTLNATVLAEYFCTDALSDVRPDGCTGSLPNGSQIDTSAVGTRTFSVTASDRAGNIATGESTYTVSYGVCALFDQNKAARSGATMAIKLRLCDVASANLSAPMIEVTAIGVSKISDTALGPVEDAGNANPDDNFRYEPSLAGYIYNLRTTGLSTGTYRLIFRVGADPQLHEVQFQVR